MKHSSKIDLKSAYNQIEIDDKFKEIATRTHPRDYWDGLACRSETASHIFQRAIEKILFGKEENILIYQDDICLVARISEELKSKIEHVLEILKQAGMTINREKCKLDREKISDLRYQISREGISPYKRLTNKIAKMEKPTNKKELEIFLGLINFNSRYIPRYSELIGPFAEMRKNERIIFMDVEAK